MTLLVNETFDDQDINPIALNLTKEPLNDFVSFVAGESGGYAVSLELPTNFADYNVSPAQEIRVRGVMVYNGGSADGQTDLGDVAWVGYKLLIPSETFLSGTNITLTQFLPLAAPGGPTFAFKLFDTGYFGVLLRTPNGGISYNAPTPAIHDYWYRVVIHYHPTNQTSGYAKQWIDGVQIVNYSGKTAEPTTENKILPKFGMYIPSWRSSTPSQNKKMYFDEFKFGDSSSSYSEVHPDNDLGEGATIEPGYATATSSSYITVDAGSTGEVTVEGTTEHTESSVSSYSFSHTHPSVADDCLIVICHGMKYQSGDSPFTFTGCTFNGSALTLLDQQQGDSTNRNNTTAVYYLAAADVGAYSVAVTASTTVQRAIIYAVSLSGVEQTTPLTAVDSNESTPPWSFSQAVNSGSALWFALTSRGDNSAVTVDSGNTEQYQSTHEATADTDVRGVGIYKKYFATATQSLTVSDGPLGGKGPTWVGFAINSETIDALQITLDRASVTSSASIDGPSQGGLSPEPGYAIGQPSAHVILTSGQIPLPYRRKTFVLRGER